MSFFDWFSGEDTEQATIGSDQEALGQQIVDQAIWEQSRLALNEATERAALAFEGAYQHATAGPAYDPTEADPYGFQEILGRAIVQQSQGAMEAIKDDSPLNRVNAADVGAWANAALGIAKAFAPDNPGGVGTVNQPKQIFSNRPGQGNGYVITPSRTGGAVNRVGGESGMGGLLVLGLVAVGSYVALK